MSPWSELVGSCLAAWNAEWVCRAVWHRTNVERLCRGLRSLERHAALDRVAAAHSRDMAQRHYFDHRDRAGRGVGERVALFCPQLVVRGTGENIARFTADTDPLRLGVRLVHGWMESPGHRANILDGDWTHLGVGICRQGSHVWATQVFAWLVGELVGEVPKVVGRGSMLVLGCRLYPPWNRPGEIEAIVRVPDSRLRIAHGNGYYGIGWYPARCSWQGNVASVPFRAAHGTGEYEVGLVKRGTGEYVPVLRIRAV